MRKLLTHAAAVGIEISSPWLDKVLDRGKVTNLNKHSLSNQHKSRHTFVNLLFPHVAKFENRPKFGAKLDHLGHDCKS